MAHEEIFQQWADQIRSAILTCPHCGADNWVDEKDEEPRCETCDGYLEETDLE